MSDDLISFYSISLTVNPSLKRGSTMTFVSCRDPDCMEKILDCLEGRGGDVQIDLAELDEVEQENAAAWPTLPWRERLYHGKRRFRSKFCSHRCRWDYREHSFLELWPCSETGLRDLGLRIQGAMEQVVEIDGWCSHRKVVRRASTRKYQSNSIIEELELMIEDGVLLVRSNSVEPLYRPRGTEEAESSPTDPSPSDCLALFRSMIILGPIERRIL